MVEKTAEAPVGAVPEDANQRKCISCRFFSSVFLDYRSDLGLLLVEREPDATYSLGRIENTFQQFLNGATLVVIVSRVRFWCFGEE